MSLDPCVTRDLTSLASSKVMVVLGKFHILVKERRLDVKHRRILNQGNDLFDIVFRARRIDNIGNLHSGRDVGSGAIRGTIVL